MRARRWFSPCAVATALVVSSPGFALTLDAFTDAFPPNPCLPNSGLPVLFVGPYCDGVACPPDPLAACVENAATQAGLPGVLSGVPGVVERSAFVSTGEPEEGTLRVRPELGRLEVHAGPGVWHGLHLGYGGAAQPLHFDPTASGASALAFDVAGDVSPEMPLVVSIVLITDLGGGASSAATYYGTISGPGTQSIPFSAFSPGAGFSFADLDVVTIEFQACLDVPCSGAIAARGYSIGPLVFETGPTATASKTWGRLKALYR